MAARYDNTDGRLRGRKAQARRLRLWSKDPCCAKCGKLTDWPSGFEVDHRTPLERGGKDVDDNLQVLCSGPLGCHAKKTLSEGHHDPAVSFFPDWLEPSAAKLTIVFGPPGSGKSTYVRERAAPNDVVIDLDEIVSALSGQPIYHADHQWLRRAAHLRNRMLADLAKSPAKRAWFITSGVGETDRKWWVSRLQPKSIVVLNVDAATCRNRVTQDARRPKRVVDVHLQAIDAWWAAERGERVKTGRRIAIGLDGFPCE